MNNVWQFYVCYNKNKIRLFSYILVCKTFYMSYVCRYIKYCIFTMLIQNIKFTYKFIFFNKNSKIFIILCKNISRLNSRTAYHKYTMCFYNSDNHGCFLFFVASCWLVLILSFYKIHYNYSKIIFRTVEEF